MDNTEDKPKATVRTPKAVAPQKPVQEEGQITTEQVAILKTLLTPEREARMLEYYKVKRLDELKAQDFAKALATLQKKEE